MAGSGTERCAGVVGLLGAVLLAASALVGTHGVAQVQAEEPLGARVVTTSAQTGESRASGESGQAGQTSEAKAANPSASDETSPPQRTSDGRRDLVYATRGQLPTTALSPTHPADAATVCAAPCEGLVSTRERSGSRWLPRTPPGSEIRTAATRARVIGAKAPLHANVSGIRTTAASPRLAEAKTFASLGHRAEGARLHH